MFCHTIVIFLIFIRRQLEILKKGGELNESEMSLKQTAQDLVDIWTEELKQFQSNFKMIENDTKNRTSEILQKHLVLLVNKKFGNKNYQTLPFDDWNDGETLREVIIFRFKSYALIM